MWKPIMARRVREINEMKNRRTDIGKFDKDNDDD